MIYLYDGTETNFIYNGKPLPEAYDVDVDFAINDEFFVTFRHPLDKNEVYKKIKEDKIVTVNTPSGMQPFRILKPIKRSRYIKIEAWPLFYADMRGKVIKPLNIKNADATTALLVFKDNLLQDTPFNFSSDINDLHDYHTQDENERENNPDQLYDALEVFKSLVQRWGGEIYVDGYDVRILNRLGTNTQVLMYEKKNISDFIDETNIKNIVTRLHGKSNWTTTDEDGKEIAHSVQVTVDSPLINEYSGVIFEKQYTNNDIRTEKEMKDWLNLKFTTDNIDKPQRTIEVKTNVVDGHYLSVGDSLFLKYLKHDVDTTIRVVGYKYDGFNNKYKQLVLGQAKTSVSGTINQEVSDSNNQYKDLENKTSAWLDAIRNSIINDYFNENGHDYALKVGNVYGLPAGYYSFDKPINQNPTKVIYIGAGKVLIANSKKSNGEWEWRTAIDANGVNADVVNTGTLNANLIRAGVLQDRQGNTTLDLANGNMIFNHNDGSETRMNAQGMFHREGGTNYQTSYLNDTVTVTGLNTSSKSNPRWINLPSIYKGKQFTVVAVFSDAYGHTESSYYNDLAVNRIVCFVDRPNIDYTNARVPVVGYVRTRNLNNESRQNWNIQVQLLVSY